MISPSEPLPDRIVVPLEFEDLKEASEDQAEELLEEPIMLANKDEAVLVELKDRLNSQIESLNAQIEATREVAKVEAREELAKEFEERIAFERSSIATLCDQFSKERTHYFLEVEAEVVRLALAIATRVLCREVALDPLLLRGAVKVALEKVQEESTVTLRVPEEQVEDWKKVISKERDDVIVAAKNRLQSGECILETSVGRVDLGIRAQLEEIEKGFFDLLERRPA